MSATRPRLPAAARREQLIEVVRALVAEQGFHAVSIEGVARRAGVSRPIVYGHFADLPGLLEALVEREAGRALEQLAAFLPPPGSPGNRRAALLGALRGYLEAVRADPVTWRLVLMPPEGAPAGLRERIAEGRAAVVARLAEIVDPGLAAGGGSPDPELTAWTMSVLSDEAARLVLSGNEQFGIERILTHAGWLLDRLLGEGREGTSAAGA